MVGHFYVPETHQISGFALGCQAYSFKLFTAVEAVEKTAQAGGRVIEFYPGQAVSSQFRDVKVGPGMPEQARSELRDALRRHEIIPVAFGVIDLPNDEARSREVFAFAKEFGIGTIVSEPKPEAMDLIENLIKEFDIRVAIHNHARRPDRPAYKHWDPQYVLSLVQGRDQRLGACADTGHWTRSGIRPVEALRILEGRVLACHLKDLTAFERSAHDLPFGTGVADMGAVLAELKRQKFDGHLSVEYEYNWEHSVPEIAQCIGFVRGWGAGRAD